MSHNFILPQLLMSRPNKKRRIESSTRLAGMGDNNESISTGGDDKEAYENGIQNVQGRGGKEEDHKDNAKAKMNENASRQLETEVGANETLKNLEEYED